jgi:ribokinase
MVTCLDTGFDPRGWSRKDVTLVRKTLSYVDIFFPNLAEARKITGAEEQDDVCDILLGMGPSIVALKMGKKGCYICSGSERVYVAPFRMAVVDTTGAGDVYGAAFICGHFRKWGLKKIGRFANAAAALSTEGFGSENYPTYAEAARLSDVRV